jgi:hypothetical protein
MTPKHFTNALVSAAIIAFATTVSVVVAQNPACYLCGGDSAATFQLPDVILVVPPELASGGISSLTCSTLYSLAVGGLLNSTACATFSASLELQQMCGCSNLQAVQTSVPAAVPVVAPAPVVTPVATTAVPTHA